MLNTVSQCQKKKKIQSLPVFFNCTKTLIESYSLKKHKSVFGLYKESPVQYIYVIKEIFLHLGCFNPSQDQTLGMVV